MRTIVAVAMSGALLVGGCSKGPEVYGPPTMASTLVDASEFAGGYVRYWQGIGVGSIAVSRVIALGPGDLYLCNTRVNGVTKTVEMRSNTIAETCISAGKVVAGDIVLGEEGLRAFTAESERSGLMQKKVNEFAIAHEVGHLVQIASGVEPQNAVPAKYEMQADCLAGKAVAVVNPSLASEAKAFYSHVDSTLSVKSHGTWVQRLEAFNHGATVGTC